MLDATVDLGHRTLEPSEDPAVLDRGGRHRGARLRADAEQDQPGGVPQLVDQRQPLGHLVLGEAHVLAGGHGQQSPAQPVGAVGGEGPALREHRRPGPALDQVQRVDAGAQ